MRGEPKLPRTQPTVLAKTFASLSTAANLSPSSLPQTFTMGSQAESNEFVILVTGFGPFREQYPVNPSWEIAKGLPEFLPPAQAKNPKSRWAVDLPPVRILIHPEPIHVGYDNVRALTPKFWDGEYMGHKIDAAIHIGMAGPEPMYKIERRAHRTGYKSKDVDGKLLVDEDEGRLGEDWIWHGLPDELLSDLDVEDILMRWQSHSPLDLDLRISEDAGNYLCDFIYYSSQAILYKQHKTRNVVFFHVPAVASEENVTRGRMLAENLIRSIAESELKKKMRAAAEATGVA